MRFPRMTTRRWMVAVVVVALLMSGIIAGYRRFKAWRDDPDMVRECFGRAPILEPE